MYKLASIDARLLGILLLLLATAHAIGNPTSTRCPTGEYFVPALGGYVLLPARYMPYAFELEPGMTGSYRSPSVAAARRCTEETGAIAGGNIQTGSVQALMQSTAKIPAHKPRSRSRVGEFDVTIWSIPRDDNKSIEWWTVLVTKNDQAIRIFDTDPELWRRILDSYFEQ